MTIIELCIQPLPYVLCFAIIVIRMYTIIMFNFCPFSEAPVVGDKTL